MIMQGVLRMPPEMWSGDALDVTQRHNIYREAANEIDRLQGELERLKKPTIDTLLAMLKPPTWGEVNKSRIMWFTPLNTVYMIEEGVRPGTWFLSKDNKNHRDYGTIDKGQQVAWDDYQRSARELLKRMLVD